MIINESRISEAVTKKVTKIDDAISHLEIVSDKFNVKWTSADAYDYFLKNASLRDVSKLLKSADKGVGDSVITLSSKGLKYQFDVSKRDKSHKKKYMIKVEVIGSGLNESLSEAVDIEFTDEEKKLIYDTWTKYQKKQDLPAPRYSVKAYQDRIFNTWYKVLRKENLINNLRESVSESLDLADEISDLLKKNHIDHRIGNKRNRIQVRKADLVKASELARTVDKDSKVAICSLV